MSRRRKSQLRATNARKPSEFNSKDQPRPTGISPLRASIGSGSRKATSPRYRVADSSLSLQAGAGGRSMDLDATRTGCERILGGAIATSTRSRARREVSSGAGESVPLPLYGCFTASTPKGALRGRFMVDAPEGWSERFNLVT